MFPKPFRTVIVLIVLFPLAFAALACNFQLGGVVPTPFGTPTAQVFVIAPANNAVIAVGAEITLAAHAADSASGVAKIDFVIDEAVVASEMAPIAAGQTEFTARGLWQPSAERGYLITAIAYRANGVKIGEASVAITAVALTPQAAAQAPTQTAPSATAVPSLIAASSTPIPATHSAVGPTPTVLIDLSGPTRQPTQPILTVPTQPILSAPASPTVGVRLPTLPPAPILISPTPSNGEGPTIVIQPYSSPTPAPAVDAPILRVTFQYLNVRAGPDTTFEIIGRLNQNDTVTIIGRNAERTWWVIERGELRGWVTSNPDFSTVTGDTANVPLAAPPGSNPTPPPGSGANSGLAPTSTVAGGADLIIEAATIPSTPRVNQAFTVLIVVRNQGTADAPASLLRGIFQPGDEPSDMAVPPLRAGQSVTLPPLYVTVRGTGANLSGVLTLDVQSEVAEGLNGEANNTRTITYNVDP